MHLFGFWLTMWGQKAGCWAAVLCRWCVLYYPVLHLCHCTRRSSWLVSKHWQPSWFWHSNINLWTLSRSTQHFCVNICVDIVSHIIVDFQSEKYTTNNIVFFLLQLISRFGEMSVVFQSKVILSKEYNSQVQENMFKIRSLENIFISIQDSIRLI